MAVQSVTDHEVVERAARALSRQQRVLSLEDRLQRLRLALAELRLGEGKSLSGMWFPGRSQASLEREFRRLGAQQMAWIQAHGNAASHAMRR